MLFVIVIFSLQTQLFMMIHQTKWTWTFNIFNRFMTWKKSEEKRRSLNDHVSWTTYDFIYPNCGVDGLRTFFENIILLMTDHRRACFETFYDGVVRRTCEKKCSVPFYFLISRNSSNWDQTEFKGNHSAR